MANLPATHSIQLLQQVMQMADVKWIKITTDIFDDEKILLIESLPEADSIIVIWFKLLCLAGKMNNSGVFMMNDKIPYTDKMLATIFRRKESTVQLALQTFENFGMVEIIDGVITIPNWGKHQNLDQLEKKRVSQREYMRQYRERQKLLSCNANGKANGKANVSRPEEDVEEDKKENKSVRETTHTLFVRLLPEYLLSDSLQDKMGEWVKYKTERKEPYKEQGMKSLLRQVENKAIQYGDDAVCSLIDECMANNWKGIIFDRLQQSQRKPASGGYHRQTKAEELNDFYTMAENWSET
nr:MAG TPA: replisome organizer [Caudoviricetes sp.]